MKQKPTDSDDIPDVKFWIEKSSLDKIRFLLKKIMAPTVPYSRDYTKMTEAIIENNRHLAREIHNLLP